MERTSATLERQQWLNSMLLGGELALLILLLIISGQPARRRRLITRCIHSLRCTMELRNEQVRNHK